MIPGLFIETDWITREREADLVTSIGHEPRGLPGHYAPRHFAGHRTVQRYGAGVHASGYRSNLMSLAVPAYLESVRSELVTVLDANAITVAWYAAGDGLEAHIDKPECGEVIAILSLLGDATMRMTRGDKSLDFHVPRRSLTLLRGEARHEWMHEIAPVISPRVAIVFRQATV